MRKLRKRAEEKLAGSAGEDAVCPTPLPVPGTSGTSGTSTRKRSLGSTPGTSQKPPQKMRKVLGQSFSEAAKKNLSLFVGPTLGEVPLSAEEFTHVKRTLTMRILDRAKTVPGWPVQVESCTHHSGRVRVICSDERSLEWLRAEARKLVPALGTRKGYSVLGPGDLPPVRRCSVWVPYDVADSKEELLQLLAVSNTGLRASGIRITSETDATGEGTRRRRLVFCSVEEDVFTLLRTLKMKPFCGMGRLEFRHRNPEPSSASPSGPPQEVPAAKVTEAAPAAKVTEAQTTTGDAVVAKATIEPRAAKVVGATGTGKPQSPFLFPFQANSPDATSAEEVLTPTPSSPTTVDETLSESEAERRLLAGASPASSSSDGCCG